MSQSKTFHLPDLGEGLPDATIVEWYVKEGDVARLDEPLVSMETAKAVVEVPSPVSGKVLKLAGAAGDVIATGAMQGERFVATEVLAKHDETYMPREVAEKMQAAHDKHNVPENSANTPAVPYDKGSQ